MQTIQRKTVTALLVGVMLVILFFSCKPILTLLEPAQGPPGTLVHVQGTATGASVLWDVGSPFERTIPGGFLAGNFFTVPMGATPGPHNVQLVSAGGRRSDRILPFNVVNSLVRPAPRIDDITCRNFEIDREGRASFFLLVHGANVDAGAQLIVDGIEYPTYLWRGMNNKSNLQVMDASTLGYPIFHYGTLICRLNNVRAGTTLRNITVRNLDRVTSVNVDTYYVASSMEELDSDGDGFTDIWETRGADVDGDGRVDVDMAALGANPLRKDVFVEVDWMAEHEPDTSVFGYTERLFRNAPVLNSDGSSGISIHIDYGQPGAGGGGGSVLPFHYGLRLRPFTCPYFDTVRYPCYNFQQLKAAYFNPLRLPIYRYCIFGHDNANGSVGGQAEGSPSNDFMVTVGLLTGARDVVIRAQLMNFLHELGHTLGLYHGGDDGLIRKPNYNSVMNYMYNDEGVDLDCDPTTNSRVFDFSQGMRRELNERCLNELTGLCDNRPIDWDTSGAAAGECVQMNLDTDPRLMLLHDYADWAGMRCDFTRGREWDRN